LEFLTAFGLREIPVWMDKEQKKFDPTIVRRRKCRKMGERKAVARLGLIRWAYLSRGNRKDGQQPEGRQIGEKGARVFTKHRFGRRSC